VKTMTLKITWKVDPARVKLGKLDKNLQKYFKEEMLATVRSFSDVDDCYFELDKKSRK